MLHKIVYLIVVSLMFSLTGCSQTKNTYLGDLELSQTLYINDQPIDGTVVGFYYGYSLTKHINQYYSYFGSVGFSMTGFSIDHDINALQEQTCTAEGYVDKTWEYYFLEKALQQYQEIQAIYESALSKGYSIGETEKLLANDAYTIIVDYCEENQIDIKSYLRSMYGKNMTKELFIENYEKIMLAQRYIEDLMNVQPTNEEVENYYEMYKDEIDTVDIRYFTFSKNKKEEATSFIEAAISEQDFQQLAIEYSDQSLKEIYMTTDATLRTNLKSEDIPEYLKAVIFDESNLGKTILIEGDSSLDIVMVVSREKPIYKSTNISILYLDARESKENELTEEEMFVCQEYANTLLEQFKIRTDASLESFYEYISIYSDDLTNDGNYSDLIRGDVPSEIESWLFDEERIVGDVEVLASNYGYCLVYFRSYGQQVYYQQARELVKEKSYLKIVEDYKLNNRFDIK